MAYIIMRIYTGDLIVEINILMTLQSYFAIAKIAMTFFAIITLLMYFYSACDSSAERCVWGVEYSKKMRGLCLYC